MSNITYQQWTQLKLVANDFVTVDIQLEGNHHVHTAIACCLLRCCSVVNALMMHCLLSPEFQGDCVV